METKRNRIIIAVGILGLFAALILPRMRAPADVSNRIHAAYNEEEQSVLKPGSGLAEVDQFARDLRTINLDGATQDVRDAMAAMIAAVEENAIVRRTGGDTNAANDKVAFAKRDLLRALDRWRGQRF